MKILLLVIVGLISFQSLAAEHTHAHDPSVKLNFFSKDLGYADAVATQRIRVVGGKMTNFPKNSREKQKILDSYAIIEAVFNSETFKERVINFKSSDGKRAYTSNRGMTNEQIYEFLMRAQELVGAPNSEYEMDFDVRRYSRFWSKVIGYTNPGKNNLINVNSKFYSKFELHQVSSNIAHEWIHLMGFFHDSARDRDSVPYAVGYIVSDLAAQFIRDGYID